MQIKTQSEEQNRYFIQTFAGVNFINILCATFAPIFFCKKLQSQTVIREKLQKTYLYKKCASSILMKLTPDVNFINVFKKSADPKRAKKTDNLIVFFVLLGSVRIKAALKTFVKSTPGVNFINIVLAHFFVRKCFFPKR